ncbi:MAG: succinate dehydrogenase/fumarate reductase flavoprotein subunit [Thermoplasmata archaeon]|nr:MAG: succinate dehydrogenase/fumarate reductase flavoprotein subunit [Thermoplasmata archaeon]
MYPKEFEKSIKKVEATREERLKKLPERMKEKEKDALLKKWHPDYKPEAKRKLKVGVSKGSIVPNEVADLLEAYPLINPDEIDLSQVDYEADILIIGGGGAGTAAALYAYYNGIKPENIIIATKLRHGDSNTIMAQGGIQAADKPNDSPIIHYLDVIGGGHFANKPDLVAKLVMDAPLIIKWHEELGIMYDKKGDGEMITIHGGGTSRKRMHSAKDYTGMEIMRVLRDEARNIGIKVLEFSPAIELLMDDDGKVAGALLYNMETDQYYVVKAKATILATGGFGRLHIQGFPTTNHYGATADGLVMAYRLGAKLRDMDSVQYHPTGVAYPEQIVGLLVTEKVRGLGAQPVNVDGEQFVHPLEPRDVEAAAIIRECYGRNKGVVTPTGMRGIWLDSPMIDMIHGEGTIEKRLGAMFRMFSRFGIDMRYEPILVFPTLHYQNGGIEIDADARVLSKKGAIPGLFAAGEVEGGVHGKNRLMGNSLLDTQVFGRVAGINAAKYAKKAKIGKLSLQHTKKYIGELKKAKIKEERKAPILLPDYREEKVLSRAIDIL